MKGCSWTRVAWLLTLQTYGLAQQHGINIKEANGHLQHYFDTLSADYDKRIRPGLIQNETTVVQCALWIKSVNQMNEMKMQYKVDFYFYQEWQDFRLARNLYNESVSIDAEFENSIWMPDTYFRNAQTKEVEENPADSYEPVENSRSLVLYRSGKVEYDKRYVMTFHCFLDLRSYPLDTQQCQIELESYGKGIEDLRYVWSEEVLILPANMLEMEIVGVRNYTCNTTYSTGIFSCLRAELTFSRRLQYYGIQVYFPMIAITFISWLAFWIDVRLATARITVGMMTSLALVARSMHAQSQVPRTPYVKSLDVWCMGCVLFVFSTLIEYTFAYQAAKKADEQETKRWDQLAMYRRRPAVHDELGDDEDSAISNFSGTTFSNVTTSSRSISSLDRNGSGNTNESRDTGIISEISYQPNEDDDTQDYMFEEDYGDLYWRIERTAKVFFPVGFAVFNCIYWGIYLR